MGITSNSNLNSTQTFLRTTISLQIQIQPTSISSQTANTLSRNNSTHFLILTRNHSSLIKIKKGPFETKLGTNQSNLHEKHKSSRIRSLIFLFSLPFRFNLLQLSPNEIHFKKQIRHKSIKLKFPLFGQLPNFIQKTRNQITQTPLFHKFSLYSSLVYWRRNSFRPTGQKGISSILRIFF